ncbi:MAG: hypothetical protein WAM30_10405 [Candidatus Dormiibacterota bacterium]
MLEAVAGGLAALLILTGLAIMIGPGPWRALRRARAPRLQSLGRRRQARPEPVLIPLPGTVNATTQQALSAASRLVDLLADHGAQRHATAIRLAATRLRTEEASGIYAMQEALGHLRRVRVEDRADEEIIRGLVTTIQRALTDRAEQLELLPRR